MHKDLPVGILTEKFLRRMSTQKIQRLESMKQIQLYAKQIQEISKAIKLIEDKLGENQLGKLVV